MIYAMKLEDLAEWVKHKAKLGDLAYCYNHYDERYYFYNYKGPDDNPFWVMFQDDIVDKYLEINKLKVEEPKMEKRCDNCKYFKNGRSYNYCSHIEHNGFIVPRLCLPAGPPQHTTCVISSPALSSPHNHPSSIFVYLLRVCLSIQSSAALQKYKPHI